MFPPPGQPQSYYILFLFHPTGHTMIIFLTGEQALWANLWFLNPRQPWVEWQGARASSLPVFSSWSFPSSV